MASNTNIAIAGIHTGIGKTIVSALLTQALEADYWKPIQAGALDDTDSMTVQNLIDNKKSIIHPEAITLQMAASPHTAAAKENRSYDCRSFIFPKTSNTLLIETAGGLLSPVDAQHTVADFISHYHLPAVLVTRHYLGSINHTLLCLEVMKQRKIPLLCLIINGLTDTSSESFIRDYAGISNVLYVKELEILNVKVATAAATILKKSLPENIFYEYDQRKR